MLQRALSDVGLIYEVDGHPIVQSPRRVDILFRTERVAVFIDGCFWHGCPLHGTQAKANADFWREKIARNQARDADTNRRLIEAGWLVVRVWEHEDPETAAIRIETVLRQRRGEVSGEPATQQGSEEPDLS